MIYQNAMLFNERFDLVRADLETEGAGIRRIGASLDGGDAADCTGCLLVPGFVDLHIHGCRGADTCDATREALETMASFLLTKGVTSFCPTTMTVSEEEICRALRNVQGCMARPVRGARILGVNMEGPFLSEKRRGAQKASYVREPDFDSFRRWFDGCGGIVKLVDIAPERPGAESFVRQAAPLCTVSLAHSEAGYEEASRAFSWGISHVTHLCNAMTGFAHRAPGAVGAALDSDTVQAELICDGLHIHPAALRILFRALGEDRTIVISDAMRAAGQADGPSELGGQPVFVKDGQARLADGTLAGSTANLHQELKNLVAFGVPLRQAVKSVSLNPARALREEGRVGSLAPGKLADFVALDARSLDIRFVVKDGRLAVKEGVLLEP